MNELQQVLSSAQCRLQIRFDVGYYQDMLMKPIAWRPVTQDKWQRFNEAPQLPQYEVYSAVTAAQGRMERDFMGIGNEMVYWFEK